MSAVIPPKNDEQFRDLALNLYQIPFKYDPASGYIFDANQNMVTEEPLGSIVAEVRGWGRIQYKPQPERLQDTVGEMIALALTEYWERNTKRS